MGMMIFIAVMTSIAATLICTEFSQWQPRFVRSLLNAAVRRLRPASRERYREEWAAHLQEVPGDISQLMVAFGFYLAAGRISVTAPMLHRVLALAVVVFLLPLIALLVIAIFLSGRRPFIQIDSKHGRVTRFNAEPNNSLGRFLIASSLDEIPLLFDVVSGKLRLTKKEG